MEKFEGVANTLFVPLVARIAISRKFPEYFRDEKALELEPFLPAEAAKGSSEYSNMASVARYFLMDRMVKKFIDVHESCNVVYLGAGLETAYFRLRAGAFGEAVHWYEIDLAEVVEARRKILGIQQNETLIPGDMFKMNWTESVQIQLPTLLVVSGVFQYFHEEEVVQFIKNCKAAFPLGEMIFDATSNSGLKFTNWFIKRTGNAGAFMYFGVDESKAFAKKCGVSLIEERTFFPEALQMLGKRLSFVTRLFMRIAEHKRQVVILHLKLQAETEGLFQAGELSPTGKRVDVHREAQDNF